MTAVVAKSPRGRSGIKTVNLEDGQRKLPRPIVFWSLNEKTAYRRNRVVQTRMNMVMDDIATQRETSRKAIRYEAHKFRQKNSRYYSHPLGASTEAQKFQVNIAPPNWKPPNKKPTKEKTPRSDESDSEPDSDDDDDDADNMSPRKKGIITRSKKPTVSFSVNKQVHQIDNDLKIDDLDNVDDSSNETELITRINNSKVRALSAPQNREIPDLPGQSSKRQQSALPVLRSTSDNDTDCCTEIDKIKNANNNNENERNRRLNKIAQEIRSENYFDKSKAAYQLRQDLRRRAKIRKQGIKPTAFTLQDAIELEKENFLKSNDKVSDYMYRIEALKREENALVNKWTRDALVQQLNL